MFSNFGIARILTKNPFCCTITKKDANMVVRLAASGHFIELVSGHNHQVKN